MSALENSTQNSVRGGLHDRRLIQQLAKTGYRLSPGALQYKLTDGGWIPARHLIHLDRIIAPALIRGGARIIVTMPPRHGKSEYCSVSVPIWALDRWPDRNVMLASYSGDLASDFSRRVRDTVNDAQYQDILKVRLKQDTRQVNRFLTNSMPKPGGMVSVGLGGTLTGRGPHIFLIDDYIKNHEEALSQTVKKGHWNWWQGTAYPRLEPNASIIILATRWAQDDLIGMILKNSHEKWTVIRLPAIAEDNDPLGRLPGEALWPERYPVEVLEVIREAMGKYWFNAQYQGAPLPSMSAENRSANIKVIAAGDLPNRNLLKTVRTWDLSGTPEDGDYTVGEKMSLHKENGLLFVEHMIRFQKGPRDTRMMMREIADIDGPGVPIFVEQEPGSAGKYVIEDIKSDWLPDRKVEGEKATGPVEVRCSPFLAACEAGKIHFIAADWNDEAMNEIDAFPGLHDDQVVSLSIGYRKLVRNALHRVVWGGEDPKVVRATTAPGMNKVIKGAVW